MKQYEKYKPSGVEWLGEIPEHWEVKRVKDIAKYVSRGITPVYIDSGILRVINQATFSKGFFDAENARFTTKGEKYALAKKDDILIASTGGGVLGKTFFIQNIVGQFFTDSHVTSIRSNGKILLAKYFYYFLSINYDLINSLMAKGSTNQTELQRDSLLNFHWCVPQLIEQSDIINYLDAKTTVIDRKIELLIAKANKYKALRRSLINETVCRGLDPNAPLKASGIEWIGLIPEHWEVKRFKDIAISITGLTYSPDDIVDEGEGILVLRSGNIQNGELSFNDNVYVNCQVSKNLLTKKDDILVCSRNGSANLVGKSVYVYKNENHTWGAFMMIVRSKMGKYLYYALNSDLFKRNMGLFQTSTVNQLTSKMLDNMDFLTPAKSEQTAIVIYLDEKTSQIDSIIANIEQQTSALARLRKTLINDVVTGKIKVVE